MNFLNPAGGLKYHVQAWFHAHGLWKPYIQVIQNWIDSWPLTERSQMILIGPSAGYSLSETWLDSFAHITICEIDPVARFLFVRRFPKIKSKTAWVTGSVFESTTSWNTFLSEHPNSPILFCNFLGQAQHLKLPLTLREIITPLLGSRPWASYHDRFSSSLKPHIERSAHPRALSTSEILEEFYNALPESSGDLELYDHDTHFFGELDLNEAHYFHWAYSQSWHHLIEGVWGK